MYWQTSLVVFSALLVSCRGQLTREQILQNTLKLRKLPGLDVCGKSRSTFEVKIINGRPAELGAYPWMANIGYVLRGSSADPVWLCAGSLITDQYVISAAHCLDPAVLQAKRPWTATTIRVGELDLNPDVNDGATPTDYAIEKIIFHEQYDNDKKINDIGLIKTKQKIRYTDLIRPICLPPPEFHVNQFVGYSPVVAGWGKTVVNKPSNDTRLLEAEVEIQDTESCKRNITSTRLLAGATIDKRVLCAASPGKDSCQGDSGGPLMFYRKIKKTPSSQGNIFLMGIVSYGFGCALEGYPGVYTRVTEYMQWVIERLEI